MSTAEVPDALLGRRVSLRHRIGERAGRPLYSDAVGELGADGDALVVATRHGEVRVARAAVVAVRAVPPAAPRRASWAAVARLESLCADAWPAPVDEPSGGWRLRAAGGAGARANSALATGSPGVPIEVALDAVRAFAATHGIGPRVRVPVGSPWDRAVTGQGWVLDPGHSAGAVLVGPCAETVAGATVSAHDPDVVLTDRTAPRWWAVAGPPPGPAERAVVDPGPPLRTVFGLTADGTGAVRAAVVEDHLHLARLTVTAQARRRGTATALIAEARRWGNRHGARFAVLQVALPNTTARALVDRLGYVQHHRYRYLVPPPR